MQTIRKATDASMSTTFENLGQSPSAGEARWTEEVLALVGDEPLERIEREVSQGESEIEYEGFAFDIEDDEEGWTYRHDGFECRDLEGMLLHLEGLLRER